MRDAAKPFMTADHNIPRPNRPERRSLRDSIQSPARPRRLRRQALHRLVPSGAVCEPMCGGPHMATNLSIDPELIERALEVSGERTKKAAVTKALEEFIARRRQRRVLELIGKLEWDMAYDYKAERQRK